MKYSVGYDPPLGRTSRSAMLAKPIEPIKELLIKGIRYDAATFRPSDWAERLCGAAGLRCDSANPCASSSSPWVPLFFPRTACLNVE